jgi:hypothetical protein
MAQTEQPDEVSAGALYKQLESDREPFLQRARECALYTIPSLIPPSGHTGSSRFRTPYQSVGARGVNHLGNKLLLALLPANTPFFRLTIDDYTLEQLTQQQGMRAKVDEGLNKMERAVQSEIEGGAYRVSGFEALKHLLVGGNVLLYLPKEGGMRVFTLSRFTVQRDSMGNVLDIVVKEDVSPAMLSPEIRAAIGLGENGGDNPQKVTKEQRAKTIEMFTHVKWNGSSWNVYQEVKGKILPGSTGTYPAGKSPWIPVRFTKVDGENYGRGYVEEYLGDLMSLEGLSQAILEGSAAAAKVLFLVNPNGITSQKTLAESPNGAIVDGLDSDVSTLQLNKGGDFRVALETIRDITERLSFAFMLNSAVQRSGERVTAEEIRFMAGELESALGGIYSILSQEMQLPLVNRIMFAMQRAKRLPPLPKGVVKPTIVTGMEALGRGNDLSRIRQFIEVAKEIELAPRELNKADALTRAGTAIGIDMAGLVKTPEQVAQEDAQAQQMAMMQQGLSPAINQLGGLAKQGMANQQKGTPPNGQEAQPA